MKEIPIKEAERIALLYDYEQVIILGMKKSDKLKDWYDGWNTTFNKDKTECDFLGKIARILGYNLRAFYTNDKKITQDYYGKLIHKD